MALPLPILDSQLVRDYTEKKGLVFILARQHPGTMVCNTKSNQQRMQKTGSSLGASGHVCYTEKATPARHRPERQHNARSNRRKQNSPNETKPYSNPKPPRKRQTTPTDSPLVMCTQCQAHACGMQG